MMEKRLNNCLVLHVHKCISNERDLVEIAKEFVMVNVSEGNTLVHFKLMFVILIVIINYMNHSFCIMGTFVSAYSSQLWCKPPKI